MCNKTLHTTLHQAMTVHNGSLLSYNAVISSLNGQAINWGGGAKNNLQLSSRPHQPIQAYKTTRKRKLWFFSYLKRGVLRMTEVFTKDVVGQCLRIIHLNLSCKNHQYNSDVRTLSLDSHMMLIGWVTYLYVSLSQHHIRPLLAARNVPLIHSMYWVLSSVSIFDNWKRNSATGWVGRSTIVFVLG